ncbi:MAG TPA: redoxin domain-containing protein [Bacteroidetes bacterium]|nr:redoxin domain-containing protein [Bacteroidota bacterium]
MRYLLIFTLVLSLFSCGDDAQGGATNATPATTKTPPAAVPTKVNDHSVVTPSLPTSYKLISKAPDPDRKLEKPNIKVEIEGLGNGKCLLIGIFTEQFFRADSTVATGGKMVFKSNEPYRPGLYYLMLPDNKTTVQMLIDADQTFTMKTKMTDLVGAMQVEGNLDNQLLYQTLKFENAQRPKFNQVAVQLAKQSKGTPEYKRLKAERDRLHKARKDYLRKIFTEHPQSLFTAFKEAGQNPDLEQIMKADGTIDTSAYLYNYRRLFWANVNFNDERLLYTPVITNKLIKYMTELTPQNPDSIKASASFLVDQTLDHPVYFKYFANWITLKYEPTKTTLMDSEAVFVHMVQNYFTYDRAFWSDSVEVHGLQLRAYEMSSSLVGQVGPNIKSTDPDGKLRSIFEMDANYIIVYMWNPECDHCAKETPKLVEFYHEWKPKGVDVYGIAVNTDDQKWRDAIKRYKMPWVNVFDPTNKSIYATYFVDNTPEIYVLNPDRVIIGKNLKVDQIQTIIERDMKKRGLM